MNTIKYLKVLSIIVIVVIVIMLGLTTVLRNKTQYKENYNECESVDNDYGLPLSVLKTIVFRKNTSYSELGYDEIKSITSTLVDAVFWGKITENNKTLKIDDSKLLETLSKQLLDSINNKIDKNEKPFKMIKHVIVSKSDTTTQDYIISSRHVIYREGKMYGFTLNVKSLWTKQNLELKGFTEVEPTGIIMEDNIFMLNDTTDIGNYREYNDSLSFIQSESIMKDKSYEDDITQRQIYGLFQDRGISAKSFK